MVLFDPFLFFLETFPSMSCGSGWWVLVLPRDAEPALPLPCSSTGRSSIPRIASPGLSLGELSQQVPALTLAFPRGIKGKERGKSPNGGKSGSWRQEASVQGVGRTLCFQHNCQVTDNSPANLGLFV